MTKAGRTNAKKLLAEARSAGRPPKEVDLDTVKVAARFCTNNGEIATFLGISARTLYRKLEDEEFRAKFEDALKIGDDMKRIRLRQLLWRLAEEGNPRIACLLAANELGWSEKAELRMEQTTNVRHVVEVPIMLPPDEWQATFGGAADTDDQPAVN